MRQTILCDVCHRVIWDEDGIPQGGLVVCVDCVKPEEEDEVRCDAKPDDEQSD